MQDRHRIPARRLQITDIRHFSADFVEVLQGQLNIRLVGNRHQMEDRISRRPHGHHGADSI